MNIRLQSYNKFSNHPNISAKNYGVFPDPVCSGRSLLPAADEQQEQEQRHDAECEGNQCALCEACHKECEERHSGCRQCVRQLGGDVVQVLTLRACRRHDGGIGDGRAMVAAHGQSSYKHR